MPDGAVLVLNNLYQAVQVTGVRRAFRLFYAGRARAVAPDFRTYDFENWCDLPPGAGRRGDPHPAAEHPYPARDPARCTTTACRGARCASRGATSSFATATAVSTAAASSPQRAESRSRRPAVARRDVELGERGLRVHRAATAGRGTGSPHEAGMQPDPPPRRPVGTSRAARGLDRSPLRRVADVPGRRLLERRAGEDLVPCAPAPERHPGVDPQRHASSGRASGAIQPIARRPRRATFPPAAASAARSSACSRVPPAAADSGSRRPSTDARRSKVEVAQGDRLRRATAAPRARARAPARARSPARRGRRRTLRAPRVGGRHQGVLPLRRELPSRCVTRRGRSARRSRSGGTRTTRTASR